MDADPFANGNNPFAAIGYDDGSHVPSTPSAPPNDPFANGSNPFEKIGYDDGSRPNQSSAPAAPSARGALADAVQSGGAGVVRGAADLAGTPGTVQDTWNTIWDRAALGAAHKISDWTGLGPQAGTKERADFDKAYAATDAHTGLVSDVASKGGIPNPTSLPTGQQVTDAVEKVGGKLPTPQTRYGQYAETIGEFTPAAIGGPGGIIRKTAEIAAPAVASETADQMTKGSPYEPYGNLARMGAAAATGVGVSGLVGAANKLGDYTAPMDRLGGFQKPIMLDDGSYAVGGDGRPLTATGKQAGLAGGFIESKATDPAAVRGALADGTYQIVDGSVPTTFQQTGDMGLGQLERSVSAANADRFLQRGADQNAARVGQIQSLQPDASPADVANHFRAMRDAMDAEHQAAAATAQRTVDDAGRAIGGAGSTPETVGAGLRDPIVQARTAAKDNENKLWDAVDPTGKMVMPAAPIAQAAKRIAGDMTPSASPMDGEEARIFGIAANYSDQMPFKDVKQLRASLNDAMADARTSGNSQSLRRLTMLRGSVEDAIDHGVENQAALDKIAVQRGQMAPDDTLAARWQREADAFIAARRAGAGTVARAGNDGAITSAGIFAGDGTQVPSFGRSRDAAGDQGVQRPSESPPPLDAEAADRLKAASAATRDRAQTFDEGVVGKALDRGPGNQFSQSDARVGRLVFHPGPTGGEDLRSYFAAGGSREAATEAAAASLRNAALRRDGTFDGPAIHQWMKQHETAINELPPEVRDRFQHSINAQDQYDEIIANQRARENDFRRSAAGPFINLHDPSSITRHVGSVFGQKNAADVMGFLARQTASDPAARDGLRRAIVEHIQNRFLGPEAGTSGTPQIRGQRFADFYNANKPVLRKVFSEDEANKLSAVVNDLERSQRSIQATQLKGRSNTLQDYLLTHPRSPDKSILSNAVTQAILAGAGHFMAGPLGAVTGWLGPKTVGAMRDAGITRIDHLVTEAMLNPDLAKALLAKAPTIKDSGSGATLGLRMRQMIAAQSHTGAPASGD